MPSKRPIDSIIEKLNIFIKHFYTGDEPAGKSEVSDSFDNCSYSRNFKFYKRRAKSEDLFLEEDLTACEISFDAAEPEDIEEQKPKVESEPKPKTETKSKSKVKTEPKTDGINKQENAPHILRKSSLKMKASMERPPFVCESRALPDFHLDRGFAQTLFAYIDDRGMTDQECYKLANVDRKTFSKIKCDRDYRPSKVTVVSFAIALRLNIAETENLLNTVGMSLSRSILFDVIIEYFIRTGDFKNIDEINEVLYSYDQKLLGV